MQSSRLPADGDFRLQTAGAAQDIIDSPEPPLASLHADIGAISKNLVIGIKEMAAAFLADISEPA